MRLSKIKKSKLLLGIAACCLLSACAVDGGSKQSAGLQVLDNEFSANRSFLAPAISGKSAESGVRYSARLAASQSKADKSVTNMLLVEFQYLNNRWLFINAAKLPGGTPLTVLVNDREVGGCGGSTGLCRYTEKMTALLPVEVLAGAVNGLRISFQGTVIELPNDYILSYLQNLSTTLN